MMESKTPMHTEKKVPLLEEGMKSVVRDKVTELKSWKEQLKMTNKSQRTDEEKAK